MRNQSLHPTKVKNVSGEEIPARAIMVVSGVSRVDDEAIALDVTKIDIPPDTAGRQQLLINSGRAIPTGGYGQGAYPGLGAMWVAYTTGDGTPAFGEMWGVADGQWKLKKNAPGFEIIGLPDTTLGIVLATFMLDLEVFFELTATLAVATNMETTPTTAAAKVLKNNTGSPGDFNDGNAITITNRWEDLSLASGDRGYAKWNWSLMEWVIVATECP